MTILLHAWKAHSSFSPYIHARESSENFTILQSFKVYSSEKIQLHFNFSFFHSSLIKWLFHVMTSVSHIRSTKISSFSMWRRGRCVKWFRMQIIKLSFQFLENAQARFNQEREKWKRARMKRGKNHKLNDNVKCPFSDCLFGHHPILLLLILYYCIFSLI